MKILIANWVYNWGSTGYILRDLKNGLSSLGWDVRTACGVNRGKADDSVFVFSSDRQMTFYQKLTRIGWLKFAGSSVGTYRLIQYIKKEQPDIVHLHLMHCGCLNLYKLFRYLSKNQIKTVVTHHAELYYTGGCGYSYSCKKFINEECRSCPQKRWATGAHLFGRPHLLWKKMKSAFDSFSTQNLHFTAVSPWVKQRMSLSPLTNKFSCDVVMNGIDITIFKPKTDNENISRRLGNNKKFVLHVTAVFDPLDKENIKGGYYIAEIANRMPDVFFVVVATGARNCDNLPSNVYFWGKAKNQLELSELYSQASLTLLTSKRETFSMICAESLCCGTPIVGFKAGGPESIALPQYSSFVDNPNLEALQIALTDMLQRTFSKIEIAELAQSIYSVNSMAKGYINVYQKLLSK